MGFRGSLLGIMIFSAVILTLTGCEPPLSAQDKIDRMASGMQAELPKMLDVDTRLVKVYTRKLELVSEYELFNYPATEEERARKNNHIETYLKNQVCSGLKIEFFKQGISSRYIYKIKGGEPIMEILLAPGDC